MRQRLATAILAAALVAVPAGAVVAVDHDDAPIVGPDLELIAEAIELIAERFVDPDAARADALTEGALRGIVDALGDDGHTVFLTPEELAAERDALDGRVTGIGIVIDRRAGSALVVSVLDGSPADRAGIRSGDRLVEVDGAAVSRLPLDELAARVRGDSGSLVRLGVERDGLPEPLTLEIVRGSVDVAPASWALVPGSDVGVVRIVQFSQGAAHEARRAIREVIEAGASGIVLDLRGNPGGLVDEAVSVAGAFIPEGVAYQERDRDDRVVEIGIRGPLISADIPIAVLVDYGTASAAEILAAALRDNGRAELVGEATFGTGTVLNTFTLSDGSAIRLAVRDWLTPAGEHAFRVGVMPDTRASLPRGGRMLDPGDLVGMTVSDLRASDDEPLRVAVRRLDPGT